MRPFFLFIHFIVLVFLTSSYSFGQLQITSDNTATALAQKLVGEGVTISNATITNSPIATGFFKNLGNTNIGMDSGIVLTNGRAKSIGTAPALTGLDNITFGAAMGRLASNNLGLPGDQDLATELHLALNQLNDAIALEFDFVPLGDSIKFNYVLSSEEYDPQYVCDFNDAFAFFYFRAGYHGN